MKIGVFGDSYAEKRWANDSSAIIWYKVLREQGHQVAVFGESGSSILFSACLIEQQATNYDLIIWCLTTPGRVSFQTDDNQWYHVCMSNDSCKSTDVEVQKKHAAAVNWIKWLFEWPKENMISAALVRDLQARHKNILIIPCFPPPLESKFNLYNLCEWEAQHWFPNKSIPEIYQHWRDLRPGHIAQKNQQRLGELIAQQLFPGVFQADYNDFILPTEPLEKVFKKL